MRRPNSTHFINIGQNEPVLLALNPNGKRSPAISDPEPRRDDFALFESGAILLTAPRTRLVLPSTRGRYETTPGVRFQMAPSAPMLRAARLLPYSPAAEIEDSAASVACSRPADALTDQGADEYTGRHPARAGAMSASTRGGLVDATPRRAPGGWTRGDRSAGEPGLGIPACPAWIPREGGLARDPPHHGPHAGGGEAHAWRDRSRALCGGWAYGADKARAPTGGAAGPRCRTRPMAIYRSASPCGLGGGWALGWAIVMTNSFGSWRRMLLERAGGRGHTSSRIRSAMIEMEIDHRPAPSGGHRPGRRLRRPAPVQPRPGRPAPPLRRMQHPRPGRALPPSRGLSRPPVSRLA